MAVLGTVFFTTKNFLEDKRNYVTDVNSVAAAHAARLLDQILMNYQNDFQHLNDLLKNPNRPDPVFTTRLKKIENLQQVNIYDANENLILSAGRPNKAVDAAWIHSCVLAFNSEKNSLFRSQDVGNASFLFVTSVGERVYAAVFSEQALLSGFNLVNALNVAVVNAQAEILTTNKASAMWQDSSLRDFSRHYFSEHKSQSVWAQLLALSDGERFLVAISPLGHFPNNGVVVLVADAVSAQLAAQITRNSLPFVFVILIFVCSLGLVFSSRLTRSLENLTEATAMISAGRWDVQIKSRSKDEVGLLVKAFKKMARELRVREEDLQKAHENLLRSEKLVVLGQFSAGIAHEIKNPLTSILTYAQLIERKLAAESQEAHSPGTFAKHIVEETLRANRIISELLTFARQKPPVLSPQNLVLLADKTLSVMEAQIERGHVKLVKKYEPQAEVMALIDSDQIRQVLGNLILNALQAMEDQPGDNKQLIVSIRQESSQALLSLQDTGPGIDSKNLQKLFDPFFSTKATGKGTGLGLSICHGIIQQHSGQITVSSKIGEGATFEIHLPLV
jgi:signal transduction histidine kinase